MGSHASSDSYELDPFNDAHLSSVPVVDDNIGKAGEQIEEEQRGELECSSQSDLDSVFGEGTDDECSDHSERKSSEYSQCRSANFSSSRSWFHSPESEFMFGSADLNGLLHDSGGSGDAFVDALGECFDAEKDQDLGLLNPSGGLQSSHHAGRNIVRGTGRPDLYDDGERSDQDCAAFCDVKHPVETFSCELDLEAKHMATELESLSQTVETIESSSSEVFTTCFNRSEEHVDALEPQDAMTEVHCERGASVEETPHARFQLEPMNGETEAAVEKSLDAELQLDLPGLSRLNPLKLRDAKVDDVKTGNAIGGLVEKRKCIMRLGSKEAEQLLQLDVAEIVKPIRLSSRLGDCKEANEQHGIDWSKEHLGPDELSRYVETLDVRETYMDTVWDMEEILLDNGENSGSRSFWASSSSPARLTRGGSLSAATSVYDGLWKVDSVEVIGARQRRGGASLGERVVGIREHTIYRIRVKSGGNEWEIERRYRDFVDLFQQLKRMFNSQTRVQLPSPWERVTAESRKIFGNTSPDVVELRSALLQVCLQSALQAGVPVSTAAPLLRFLFPTASQGLLPALSTDLQSSDSSLSREQSFYMQLKDLGSPKSDSSRSPERQQDTGGGAVPFGRTIRLILQIQARKPLKQQLLNQRNLCAGCYEQLSSTPSLVSGFAKGFGWGKPRFCEYTGQLFCSACHLNESAILPARVLQLWDFTPKNVSQLAKAYLDSIYDQPMLCVSAVNPFLYSRVPILAHVGEMRRKLSNLISCIRCPSRGRIQQMLGSRRYLLEQNDFYALHDLADLSKGAFAVLPGLLQTTLERLSLHVTQKCSVCLELGEPCVAGAVCESPSDLIYPYQDETVHRCQLCNAAYHKACFKIIETCQECTRDSPADLDATASHQSAIFTGEWSPSASSKESEQTSVDLQSASVEKRSDEGTRPKRKLFSSLLGSKNEKLIDRRNSAILNMSAILGPLEL